MAVTRRNSGHQFPTHFKEGLSTPRDKNSSAYSAGSLHPACHQSIANALPNSCPKPSTSRMFSISSVEQTSGLSFLPRDGYTLRTKRPISLRTQDGEGIGKAPLNRFIEQHLQALKEGAGPASLTSEVERLRPALSPIRVRAANLLKTGAKAIIPRLLRLLHPPIYRQPACTPLPASVAQRPPADYSGRMTFENRFEGSVWQSEPVRPRGPDVVLVGWHVFELRGASGFTWDWEYPWTRCTKVSATPLCKRDSNKNLRRRAHD